MSTYKKMLSIEPHRALELQQLAAQAAMAGDAAWALALLDEILLVTPHLLPAWCNRGNALDDLGRSEEAIASYDRALAINPNYEMARLNREIVCRKMANVWFHEGAKWDAAAQPLRALDAYEQALVLCPVHHAANLNAALALEALGRLDEAVIRLVASEAIEPGYVDGLNRAGVILAIDLGRHHEALACYDRSLALKPDQLEVRWNRSQTLLALGQYHEGWRDYHTRSPSPADAVLTGWFDFPQPAWRGEPIAGLRILLWSEQGFGDVFQFVRYAQHVRDLGATVFMLVHPSIERLFKIVYEPLGIHIILGSAQASPYHYQCSLMALPIGCGTDSVQKIPNQMPYLWPDTAQAQRWRTRLAQEVDIRCQRVGLVWAGGHRPGNPLAQHVDAQRSLALSVLAPLRAASESGRFAFFSLQLGEPANQLAWLQSQQGQGLTLLDYTQDLHDWADTAALIANLDLVISCDTAVAHLAAAMGKPTWILSRLNGCWRWLEHRDDSPWYPTVRLFRQTRRGDWTDVVDRVVSALATFDHEAHNGVSLEKENHVIT